MTKLKATNENGSWVRISKTIKKMYKIEWETKQSDRKIQKKYIKKEYQ